MKKSEEINELATALNIAQAEMGGATTDAKNPFFKSKYADLGSIIKVIKPPFANNGLTYSQFPITSENRIGVETIIMHKSGQFISNEFTMNVPKADPQSAGGVISYCRRYALQAICGIPAVDSDAEDFMQTVRAEASIPEDQKAVPADELVDDTTQPEGWMNGKVIWPGKQKHKGKMLEVIAKEDPQYLKDTLRDKSDLIEESDPDLLKAIKWVVDKMGKDFPDAK